MPPSPPCLHLDLLYRLYQNNETGNKKRKMLDALLKKKKRKKKVCFFSFVCKVFSVVKVRKGTGKFAASRNDVPLHNETDSISRRLVFLSESDTEAEDSEDSELKTKTKKGT